jgi:hypothetical protein
MGLIFSANIVNHFVINIFPLLGISMSIFPLTGIYKYERRYFVDNYGNTDSIRISAFKRLYGVRRDRHERPE